MANILFVHTIVWLASSLIFASFFPYTDASYSGIEHLKNCTQEYCGSCVRCYQIDLSKIDHTTFWNLSSSLDCDKQLTYMDISILTPDRVHGVIADQKIDVYESIDYKNLCHGGNKVTRYTLLTKTNTPIRSITADVDIVGNPCNLVVRIRELPYATPKPSEGCTCSRNLVLHKCMCYSLSRPPGINTWDKASKYCQNSGAELASIRDQEESKELMQLLMHHWWRHKGGTPNIQDGEWAFLGMRDQEDENSPSIGNFSSSTYRWIDGSPAAFFQWYHSSDKGRVPKLWQTILTLQSQPTPIETSKCLVMYIDYNYLFKPTQWFKIPCSVPIKNSLIICERRADESAEYVHNITRKITEDRNKQDPVRCRKGWTYHRGQCYMLFTSTKNLKKASLTYSELTSMCVEQISTVASLSNETFGYLTRRWRHLHEYGPVLFQLRSEGSFKALLVENTPMEKEFIEHFADTLESKYKIRNCTYFKPLRSVICQKAAEPRNSKCKSGQWQCSDGSCISMAYVCDGVVDCKVAGHSSGLEDEASCNNPSFKPFVCSDKQSIPYALVCDFIRDCQDGSDESFCEHKRCDPREFKCNNGQCIGWEKECDMLVDCIDKSDESEMCNLLYGINGKSFRCYSGKCIPIKMKNDIYSDCPGLTYEDEHQVDTSDANLRILRAECSGVANKQSFTLSFCPSPDEVRCQYAYETCFKRQHVCIYDIDESGLMVSCRDGSHLKNCEDHECPGLYKCPASYCVPVRMVCDGVKDCPHGEDEIACSSYTCPAGFFRCKHEPKICLDQSEVGDGRVHCSRSNDDERLLSFTCPNRCFCRGYAVTCPEVVINPSVLSEHARYLDLSGNRINLTQTTFNNFSYLSYLILSLNQIKGPLLPRTFEKNPNLLHLDLSQNNIETISDYAFWGLINLQTLILSSNQITNINPFTFAMGKNLAKVEQNIQVLDLRYNQLLLIPSNTFLSIGIKELKMDTFSLCCAKRANTSCTPKADEFSSCEDLLANTPLQYSIWVLGFMALFGNLFVLAWRLIHRKGGGVENLLVTNLSVADLLMGVYLIILAAMDTFYRGTFGVHSELWAQDPICFLAGVISMVSSEISVFLLMFITADRVIAIVFAFHCQKVTVKQAAIVVSVAWTVIIAMAVLPIPAGRANMLYSRNAVCMPFNLRPEPDVFGLILLTVNLLAFLFIAMGYLAIYYVIRKSKKSLEQFGQRRDASKEMKFVRRMSLVIMSDFCCWVPVVMMKYAAATGAIIPGQVSAWVAVFVLPLNSSINPFLYTITNLNLKKVRRKAKSPSPVTKQPDIEQSNVREVSSLNVSIATVTTL